jgi:hypothetical protein
LTFNSNEISPFTICTSNLSTFSDLVETLLVFILLSEALEIRRGLLSHSYFRERPFLTFRAEQAYRKGRVEANILTNNWKMKLYENPDFFRFTHPSIIANTAITVEF